MGLPEIHFFMVGWVWTGLDCFCKDPKIAKRKGRKSVTFFLLCFYLVLFTKTRSLFDPTANLTGGTMTHAIIYIIFAHESMGSMTEEV